MRPLEILLPILLAGWLLWPFTGQRRHPLFGFLPLIIVVIHGFSEGFRWQMDPLYGFFILVCLFSLPALWQTRTDVISRPRGWSLAGLILALVLLSVSTALPTLFPVPAVPAPHGSYPVGTRTYVLTDTSRKEIYSAIDQPRKFIFQVWYPAQKPAPNTPHSAWMAEAKLVAPAIADYLKLPHFFLDHLTLAKSAAYDNLPPNTNDGPYPLLIFSHGWNGFRQQTTFLMQELASQGYVVVSLEYPYASRLTVFPDGTLVPNDPQALPPSNSLPQAEYEAVARILVNQWAGDIAYTLDFLTKANQNDPEGLFTNLLDLNKVGAFGHSTGGGATIQFCGVDPRCKAGLTLDAFMRPVGVTVLENGTPQPFFYIFSELWPYPRNTEIFNQYLAHTPTKNHVVTLLGTDHYDFTDLPALSPLAPQLGLKGPLAGARVQDIVREYVLAFFNAQFKNQPAPLLDGPSPAYPEVRFDR